MVRSRRRARCRSTSSTARRRCTRRSQELVDARRRRRSTSSTSPSARAAEEAQNLMSVDFCTKEEKEAIADGAARASRFDTPVRQGDAALHPPRHRPAPRRAAAEVPPAGREAGAAGPAQGHLRHRHARRRRQHPDPHRALHQLCKFDGEKTGDPERARLPADRRPRRAQGLRRPRQRGRAGARARDREPAARGRRPAATARRSREAEAAREGLRRTGTRAPSSGSSTRRPSRWSRASRSRTACCSTCCRARRARRRLPAAGAS